MYRSHERCTLVNDVIETSFVELFPYGRKDYDEIWPALAAKTQHNFGISHEKQWILWSRGANAFYSAFAGQTLDCVYVYELTLINNIATCHRSSVCLQGRSNAK